MKHPFYIKDADIMGVEEAYKFLTGFYQRYPSGGELAEAIHQIRRDLDLIKDPEPKIKRTKKTIDTDSE